VIKARQQQVRRWLVCRPRSFRSLYPIQLQPMAQVGRCPIWLDNIIVTLIVKCENHRRRKSPLFLDSCHFPNTPIDFSLRLMWRRYWIDLRYMALLYLIFGYALPIVRVLILEPRANHFILPIYSEYWFVITGCVRRIPTLSGMNISFSDPVHSKNRTVFTVAIRTFN
jgi:hypothetical protein